MSSNKIGQDERTRHRLTVLKDRFESGKIESFQHIFMILPSSIISRELNMGFHTLQKKVDNPNEFTFGEATRLAELVGIQKELMFQFIHTLIASPLKKGKTVKK